MDCLKSVCEYFESECRECLSARTEALTSFKGLGPPDMCSLIKAEKSSKPIKEVSSYHFVTGVDCSTSASVAAYMNSLLYLMPESPGWLSKTPTFTIRSGVYCCWNAFSKLDIRVEVKIPGGVEAYGVDGVHDHRIPLTQDLWSETYVSGMLRSLQVDQDTPMYPEEFTLHNPQSGSFYQHLMLQLSIRTVNPIPTPGRDESKFLQQCSNLFSRGYLLECPDGESTATSPNLVNNFLSRALSKYFDSCQRHQEAIQFYKKLLDLDPEIGSLLAPAMISNNQDIDAVRVWYECNMDIPLQSSNLLQSQSKFLWKSKNNLPLALQLSRQAVKLTPGDSEAWLLLADLLTDSEDYKSALLALNSCPAYIALHESVINGPGDLSKGSGVFSNLIELLRFMPAPMRKNFPVNDESIVPQEVRDEVQAFMNGSAASGGSSASGMSFDSIVHDPMTFFSGCTRHRDACDIALYKLRAPFLKGIVCRVYSILCKIVYLIGWDELLRVRAEVFVMEEEYKDAKHKAESEFEHEPAVVKRPWQGSQHLTVSTFNKKRLCERWFDSLFIILYDDLKCYTIYKAEVDHAREEKSQYIRTPLEWELLGDLCARLHRMADAKECYQFYLEKRYNFRVWAKLTRIALDEGKIHTILGACENLVNILDRWHWGEIINPCSTLCVAMTKLVVQKGAAVVRSSVQTMKLAKRTEKLLNKLIDWVEQFHPSPPSINSGK